MYSKNINIFDDQYYTGYVKKSMLYLYNILYSLILIKICTKENNIAVYLLSCLCNSCLKKATWFISVIVSLLLKPHNKMLVVIFTHFKFLSN